MFQKIRTFEQFQNSMVVIKRYMINSVAISVVSSVHCSLIFPYVIATFYHSNLRLFLAVDEIKCKYGNNSRLKSRSSFPQVNIPLSKIICDVLLFKETSLRDKHFFCLFSKHKHSFTKYLRQTLVFI